MADNSELKLIVGLGNPGDKYKRTRHNAGFMVVEELARRHGLTFSQKQARAVVARGTIKGVPVALAMPQTFMNDSGESVSGLLHWFKIPTSQLMVVHDEMDLPLGTIRMRERGSAAGHNGMKSINNHLHTQDYPRLRIGIDKSPGGDTISWVLGHFSKDEQSDFEGSVKQAADALEAWLTDGIERTMNTYNSAQQDKKNARPSRPQQPEQPEGAEAAPQQAPKRPDLPGMSRQIRELQNRLRGLDKEK